MKRPRVLVAGITEASPDDAVLLAAVELARTLVATLHLVHAYTLPTVYPLVAGVEPLYPGSSQEYAEGMRMRVEQGVRELVRGIPTVYHVLPGPADLVLGEAAGRLGADLVLVGAARHGRITRTILGTTAGRVVRGSAVPVLVLRQRLGALSRVLLTTDLSDLSATAHERALDLVESVSGPVVPRVRSLLTISYAMVPEPLAEDALKQEAIRELSEFLQARRPRWVHVEPVVEQGPPVDRIVAHARGWPADLLVLGTHSRHGLDRLVLGSVAEATLRDAPCNVLVVPAAAVAADAPEEIQTPALLADTPA